MTEPRRGSQVCHDHAGAGEAARGTAGIWATGAGRCCREARAGDWDDSKRAAGAQRSGLLSLW